MKTRRATFSNIPFTPFGAVLLVVSVFTYLYFLNQSVIHVVLREEAERTMSDRNTEIANLEASLIEAQFTITERVASLDDYQTEHEKIFVTRGDASLVLQSQ